MQRENTIFITGGRGMLGQHILSELRQNGFTKVLAPSKEEVDLLDVLQVQSFIAKHKPEYVFHCAGLVFGLGGNMKRQLDSIYFNSLINLNLLNALRDTSVKKVFIAGTVASYPFPYTSLPLAEEQLFSGIPHAGELGYALAKTLGYQFANLLKTECGIDYCVGVLTNLFGEFDRFNPDSGHVVPSLIYKLALAKQQGKDFHVWGNGEATRDFLYARDAAKAAIFLMQKSSGLINISSGIECKIRTLVETLVEVSDFEGKVRWQTDAPVGVMRRVVDNSRLKAMGFDAFTPLSTALSKSYEWFVSSENAKRFE